MWRTFRARHLSVYITFPAVMPTPARIRYPWRPVAVGAVAAFTALMSATLTAAASTSGGGDLPLDDEFRTDPIFFQQEETAPHAGEDAC